MIWLRKRSGILIIGFVLIFSAITENLRIDSLARPSSAAYAQVGAEESTPIYLPLVIAETANQNPPVFQDSLFGIELNNVNYWLEIQQTSDLAISFTRVNGIRWGDIEPVEGDRNWSAVASVEEEIKMAAMNNTRAILVIRKTPDWAQKVPGSACGPIKENKLEAFANFVSDVVTRYRGAPYYVKYWEIYNEPDIAPELLPGSNGTYGCWGDSADEYYGGGYYATMLKSVYPKIKQADPEAQVLVGGMLMSYDPASGVPATGQEILASKFFEGILANGGGSYFDGVGFHNYDFYLGILGGYWSRKWDASWDTTGPTLIIKARFLRNLMDDYGVSGKFLMNTETALLCGSAQDPPGGKGCENDPESIFEQTKAYYVTQSYAAALAEGLKANVWYSLTGWRNSGLVYSDFSPRPAFHAFLFTRKKLEEATFIGPVTSEHLGGTSSVHGYRFQHPDGRPVWVIWSVDREGSTISLADPPSGVWDAYGDPLSVPDPNSMTVAYSMAVTLKPLFIEWGP